MHVVLDVQRSCNTFSCFACASRHSSQLLGLGEHNNYITFNPTNTRSGSSNKLLLPHHLNNILRHSYFHRLPSLWNAIPILDLNMSVCWLKSKLKSYLWDHFLTNFDENNNCTLHYLCPCSRSHQTKPPTTNFNHL